MAYPTLEEIKKKITIAKSIRVFNCTACGNKAKRHVNYKGTLCTRCDSKRKD